MLVGASTATSFQDRGLRPDTAYTYAVSAVNGARAAGPTSEPADATTPPEPIPTISMTLAVTAFAPADGLEMNRPSVRAFCSGGSGLYGWTMDWDGGDLVQALSPASSPRTAKLPSTHPGLDGSHTLRVSCADTRGPARGEATATIAIGAREIVAELVPASSVKWVGRIPSRSAWS
jgi:hypothetical protein